MFRQSFFSPIDSALSPTYDSLVFLLTFYFTFLFVPCFSFFLPLLFHLLISVIFTIFIRFSPFLSLKSLFLTHSTEHRDRIFVTCDLFISLAHGQITEHSVRIELIYDLLLNTVEMIWESVRLFH